MLDRKRLRKKVLLGLLSKPLTVLPVLLGSTALAAAWALDFRLDVALFAAVACLAVAAGAFLTTLVIGDEKVVKEAIEDLQNEAHEAREKRLDRLDRDLTRDGDPRTEACLRDLRTLTRAFNDVSTRGLGLNASSAFDLASGVEELFNGCVHNLRQSLNLYVTASKMESGEARRPILERRERIISEVRESIEQLSRILAGVQSLGAAGASVADLRAAREELEERLAVARRVEERLRALDAETSGRSVDTLEGNERR